MSVQLPEGIEQRLVRHRLARCFATLQEFRDDLQVTREQFEIMYGEAADFELRLIVSETPNAGAEYRDSQRHLLAISRRKEHLESAIAHHELELDDLLGRLKSRDA